MKLSISCILLILVFSNSRKIEVKKNRQIEDVVEVISMPPKIEKKNIIKDLHILHPAFRNKVIRLLYECKKQGIELKIVETYRSSDRQNKLKKKRITKLKGGRSKHQHYLAVDVVPIINKKAAWHNKKLWKQIGIIGEKQGLIWGGRWRARDYCHFEYPCSLEEINKIPFPDTILIPLPNTNHLWK